MNHLWSPWRMNYVSGPSEPGCIFCILPRQQDGEQNLIVHRGEHAYVVLNRYPYTSGHLMVVANAHVTSLEDLEPAARAEIMELVTACMRVLRAVYSPQAFNVGANIGEAAGAGVAGHVHIHIVPRWAGDTNFMSTVGETRVLPEELQETYRRVRAAWAASAGQSTPQPKEKP